MSTIFQIPGARKKHDEVYILTGRGFAYVKIKVQISIAALYYTTYNVCMTKDKDGCANGIKTLTDLPFNL